MFFNGLLYHISIYHHTSKINRDLYLNIWWIYLQTSCSEKLIVLSFSRCSGNRSRYIWKTISYIHITRLTAQFNFCWQWRIPLLPLGWFSQLVQPVQPSKAIRSQSHGDGPLASKTDSLICACHIFLTVTSFFYCNIIPWKQSNHG